jgi:CRISPR/Cas system-associated exonuclease Cas4 (RecB family)
MGLPLQSDLLRARSTPTVWVTWLAKVLADPSQCKLPAWTLTRYSVVKDDGYTGDWAVKHAAIIETVQARLAAKDRASEVEREVFIVSRTGLPITGSIDVWAPASADQTAVAIDAKTGKHSPSHRIQVNIYQLMAAGMGLSPEGEAAGLLCYPQRDVWIKPEEASPLLAERLAALMEVIAGDSPPVAAPSRGNCRYCSLREACPAAWRPGPEPAYSTALF